MRRRDSAVVDSVFSLVGVLAQGLARFAYTLVVGRMLAPALLAEVNTAFAIAILASLLWPTAAANAAAAFARADRPAIALTLGRSFARSLTAVLLLAVAAAAVLGGEPAMILQVGALAVAWSGYVFGRGVFIGAGRVRAAAIWDVVTGLAAVGMLGVFVVCGWTTWLLVPAIIGYAVYTVAAIRARTWRGGDQSSPSSERPTRGFIVWNSLALLATNGLMQMSMLVASGFDSGAQAGQFAAALSLATPVSMVAQAVTQAMLPRFGQWTSWGATDRDRALRATTGALAGVMALGCGTVAMLLPWVLPLVYGPQYQPAVSLAQALMLAVFGFSMSVFFAAYLATVGRAKVSTLLAAVGAVGGLAVMLVGAALTSGGTGAALGAIVGMVLSATLLAGETFGRDRGEQLRGSDPMTG